MKYTDAGIDFVNEYLVPLMIDIWNPFMEWVNRLAELRKTLSA